MEDQMKTYEKYALGIKHLLYASGLWPTRVPSKTVKIITIIYIVINVIFDAALLNWLFRNATSIIMGVRAFNVVAGGLTTLMKLSLFWGNRDAFVDMHETLEKTFREDVAQPEFQSEMLSGLRFFYGPTIMFLRSVILLPFAMFSSPTIAIIKQFIRGDSPMIYHLAFLTQYPWNHLTSFSVYAVHYVFEFITAVSVCLIHVSTDTAFGFYIFQMSTQFRALSLRMKNLKSTDDYQAVVKECVCRQEVLTKCRDTLEHIYGPIVISFVITSSMSLCSSIFLLSQMNLEHLIGAMVYIVEKLLQAFLYGWFGLYLTMEAENFREAVYDSNWPGSGELSFMSNVHIMLMCRPLTISACSFSIVSLDIFTAIVNTALSYFFLLKTLEDPK